MKQNSSIALIWLIDRIIFAHNNKPYLFGVPHGYIFSFNYFHQKCGLFSFHIISTIISLMISPFKSDNRNPLPLLLNRIDDHNTWMKLNLVLMKTKLKTRQDKKFCHYYFYLLSL